MNTNTTYLDVLGNIAASGETGIRYATLSRAAKRHVMSLAADGVVAAYLPSGEAATLDNPEAVVCVTAEQGAAYVSLLQEGGLLSENIYEQPLSRMPKANRKRRGKVAAAVRQQRAQAKPKAAKPAKPAKEAKPKTVPTPTESLESPMVPKGKKLVRRVPGNQHGETMLMADVSVEDRMAALEEQMNKKFSALLAAVEATASH